MRLARMGAFHPTRLSFMRSLVRLLNAEGVQVRRPVWEIGPDGYGRAVYTLPLGGHDYSLVAFSHPLDDARRTDRVIAEAWDTTYVLYDGIPSPAEIDRLAASAPRQEAARFRASDLILSRANRSQRLFNHVTERLAAGRQPDRALVREVGYLMRTTAVYGNGKFGIADRSEIAARPFMAAPFRAEMLTVWLIREFTLDLVEHVGGAALDPEIRRFIGIGNATGLGMAPFLVNHPALLDRWMTARETALARVRAQARALPGAASRFRALLDRASAHLAAWTVADTAQMQRIETLRAEVSTFRETDLDTVLSAPFPWDRMIAGSAARSAEFQELLVALVLEPHGDLIDNLTEEMHASADPPLDPSMRVADLSALLGEVFGWALGIEFDDPAAQSRFWYVSEEKLEPRLGERLGEPGADREQPLDIARQVKALAAATERLPGNAPIAALLIERPDLRAIARRVQALGVAPYSEIRDNLIGADCVPTDMLRCKLSFFGATRFDPKSDRWTRITMYQGAPTAPEIGERDADDWAFPVLGPDPAP